ncbi:MAG: TlpA disulfide reductase family protein [Dehalococcoidales bacterium]|nr:TlpA disulfide reductase family protein [Dehalococcoidales bacterium]
MKILKIALCLPLFYVLLIAGCSSALPSVAVTGTTTIQSSVTKGNRIGNLAFDFQLQNLDGQNVSLNGLRGNPVMLNFWATWCGPCRGEMPFLQQIHETWKDKGLVLLEIDIQESPALVKKFMTDNNLSIPTILDGNGSVSQAYGITAIPTTIFIDKEGIIRQIVRGAFSSKESIESQLSRIIP